MRHRKQAGDIAGGEPERMVAQQQAIGLEARILGEGRKERCDLAGGGRRWAGHDEQQGALAGDGRHIGDYRHQMISLNN